MEGNDKTQITITIRLSGESATNLQQMANARQLSPERIGAEAIEFYMDAVEKQALNQIESIFAEELHESSSRICAFLSKIAIDSRMLLRMVGKNCDEGYVNYCRTEALRQITPTLTQSERYAAAQLSEKSQAANRKVS